ncbi:hypothetical protein BC939DRAFT_479790 [Gamsiella multidivaricata]|uniref:uncharacterized protein n=1 Tax=Gamsiella multidivaricata TaxID=101098 RepID=UPI00221FE758|nr:uncharacterized protein BC939DRAFT_479790 [Gamsiella multidivaricata]KAG0365841.1 hypothetical protein BGZ54_006150 [Gamsiella multidivaricata]KAI7819127.1 hypothetical protein BC939DRAFT_479790 [Gamsiella multidivaricata]
MIPFQRTAFAISRTKYAALAASYTTRSNGAAFLNNLDFLAPAPTSRSSAPTPSQPTPFQETRKNTQQRQQPLQTSISRKSAKGTLSLDDSFDDLFPANSDTKSFKGSFKRSDDRITAQRDQNSRPALDRPRRDEEIDLQWIQYISPEGNQGERRLSSVLKTFDRSQYFLVEVDPNARPPICKLFSKKELYEKAKAVKQAKKANEISTKELQLNWGTDSNDLTHKLSKFRAFLEKGHRLEVQVNGKKGRNTTPAEREAVLERLKAEFEPVSKYVKQPEWIKATTVTMLLQGVSPKKAQKGKEQQA